ncbi:unnamed protein product, partial [Musa acuminata subsp. burmannicoides]
CGFHPDQAAKASKLLGRGLGVPRTSGISCGFDPDQAAKASKLLGRVESRHQPDSVLGLFKSYGFDNTQVKKVISANPRWLLLDVEDPGPKVPSFAGSGLLLLRHHPPRQIE